MLVIVGGTAAVLLLYVFGFILPSTDRIHGYEKTLAKEQRDLDEARSLAAELQGLKAAPSQGPSLSAMQAVDQYTKELGVTPDEIRAIGAEGAGVELRLSNVNGETLVRLLHSLETAGVKPDGLELRDFKGSGLWSVRLTVSGAQGTMQP